MRSRASPSSMRRPAVPCTRAPVLSPTKPSPLAAHSRPAPLSSLPWAAPRSALHCMRLFLAPRCPARTYTSSTVVERDVQSLTQQISQSIDLISRARRLERAEKRLQELEGQVQSADPSDHKTYGRLMKEFGELSKQTKDVQGWRRDLRDYVALVEDAKKENDQGMMQETIEGLRVLHKEITEAEFGALMSQPADGGGCFVEIRAGAGGTEAQDWAQMLLSMYSRWARTVRRFQTEVVEETPGAVAGIKNAVLKLQGDHAYGWTRTEAGVHRLVRISPFDSLGKRHTSFASVTVLPLVDDRIVLDVPESSLKIEVTRSSGAGGQHVNKTESAVRITHIPTGIVVKCQSQRSQISNRKTAMEVLRARLYQLESAKRTEQKAVYRDEVGEAQFGAQIRSYVLHPYLLVKDLRTGHESTSPEDVLNGNLDSFIEASLRHEVLSSPVDTHPQDK